MIDRTVYAVVAVGPLTASGQSEIQARFIFRKDAVAWMKLQHGTLARARNQGLDVIHLAPNIGR